MNERHPLISVAIVTYNCAKTLDETIRSVTNQDYDNKELIVVDGGSNDETTEIIKKCNSIKLRWISEPDNGIYDAMNKSLRMAKGDFLIFLGSDDHFVSNNVLTNVVSYISDYDVVYYGNVLRPQRNDIYCRKYNKYKLAVKNICHQAIFYPRNIYNSYNYNTKYRLFADYAYNIELWKLINFQYVPIVVSWYNEKGESASQNDPQFFSNRKNLIVRNLGLFPYVYSSIYHFFRNLFVKQ